MLALGIALLAVAAICGAWTWLLAVRVWRTAPGAEKQRLRSNYGKIRAANLAVAVVGLVFLWIGIGSLR